MDQPQTSTGTDDTSTATDDAPLGDAGKRALEAERKARREAEQRAHQAETKVRHLELANERRDVATAKGLTADQAKYLTGDSREELEAAADGLMAAFGTAGASTDDDKATGRGKSRPREALRGGASADSDDDGGDPSKVADSILSRNI